MSGIGRNISILTSPRKKKSYWPVKTKYKAIPLPHHSPSHPFPKIPLTMHSATLPLSTPTPSITTTIISYPKSSFTFHSASIRKSHYNSLICKASSSSSPFITDFDLYDLLGIDSSSDHAQIKLAYRSLQKQCHPDIAGPPGHDMAIVLNEAYAILSNPSLRFAYDKVSSISLASTCSVIVCVEY